MSISKKPAAKSRVAKAAAKPAAGRKAKSTEQPLPTQCFEGAGGLDPGKRNPPVKK